MSYNMRVKLIKRLHTSLTQSSTTAVPIRTRSLEKKLDVE